MRALSGASRRHLRALGHHLQPVVQVGKEGATPALVAAVKSALDTHELIKVRLGENAEGGRHELAASIANSSESELVEQLGRTLLLYRRHPKKPKIALAPENEKRKKRAAGPAPETERKPAASDGARKRPREA
jgi:RNA-binding protein